jgi:outer membrane protein assembly factor BamD (BamD/ComL family)
MGRKQSRGRKHLYFYLAGLIFLLLSGCAAPEKVKIVEVTPQERAEQHLRRSRERLAQKDFEGALAESQEGSSLANHQPPEDEAFFMVGLIYAHPENPKRNPMKSLFYFNRVTTDYPQSLWVGQTVAWVGMLQENGKLNLTVENLDRRVSQLQLEKSKFLEEKEAYQPLLYSRELLGHGRYEEASRELQKFLSPSSRHPCQDEALFQLGLIYAHPGNSKRDYGKSMSYFKRLMKDYPQSPWSEMAKIWTGMIQENEKLNQAVDRLSQTIEKSKRVDIEIEEKKREKGK